MKLRVVGRGLEWLEARRVLSGIHGDVTWPLSDNDTIAPEYYDHPLPALVASTPTPHGSGVTLGVKPASRLPELPGLTLVDPDTDVSGQIIFLDFDGAEDVIYNGPVTVGPFDVPAFKAPDELVGQEEAIIASVVDQLEQAFAGSGVIFTTGQPAKGVDYSTIYIGGDDSAFREYGSFLGLAERVDNANSVPDDRAFVFTSSIAATGSPVHSYLIHEVAHVIGYSHTTTTQDTLLDLAATYEHAYGQSEYESLSVSLGTGGTSVTHAFSIDGIFGNGFNSWRTDWYSTRDTEHPSGFLESQASNAGNIYTDPSIARTFTTTGTFYVRAEVFYRANVLNDFSYKETHQWELSVAQPFNSGPRITSQSPSGTTGVSVSSVDVTFNEPINGSTFTTSDVSVSNSNSNIAVQSVSHVSGNKYRIAFNGSLITPDTYNLVIGPNIADTSGNAMNQDNDTVNGESTQDQYTGSFTIPFDSGPRITSQTPTGTFSGSVRFVDVTFSEAVNDSSFTLADVQVTSSTQSISVASVSSVSGNTYRISFNGTLFTPDTYNLLIGPNITDVAANLMNQDNDSTNGESTQDRYSGSFVIPSVTSMYRGNIPRPANLDTDNLPDIDVYFERITSSANGTPAYGQPIQSSVETWVVAHGRVDNAGSFESLAAAISSDSDDQVLVLDWREGAADNHPPSIGLDGAGWIPSVADWATSVLSTVYGIGGPLLRLAGHSWGSFVAYDMADNEPSGVNSIVALDPATAAFGGYEESSVDFGDVSNLSWALYGDGQFGSDNRAGTAHESFVLRYAQGNPSNTEKHRAPVDVFETLVRDVREHRIGEIFALERLEQGIPGPWREDQYSDTHLANLQAFEGRLEVRGAPAVDWDDISELRYRRLDHGQEVVIAGTDSPFPPVVSTIASRVVNEHQDTGEISFTVSDAETPDALLTVTASVSDTLLVPLENIVLGGSGFSRTIRLTPDDDQYGTTTVTLRVTDLSGLTSSRTFILSVNPVNDDPSFAPGGSVVVDENSGAYSAIWATNISRGPDNESDQTLMFEIVSNDNEGLFSVAPEISAMGRLTFTPATNRDGVANLTVRLKDSGGIDNGGDDTSPEVDLRITVNDAPPTLAISVTSADKDEGDSGNTPFTFTVLRSGDVSIELDAIWTVTGSGGTLANADDFGGTFPNGPVHFDANETTAQIISVNVPGDGVTEPDEGFTVTLSNATGGATITTATAIGTIRNDDSATVIVSGPDPMSEGDTGQTPFDFTVTLSNPVDVPVSLQINTTDGTATTANNDYAGLTVPITFQFGETLSQTTTVAVNGDTTFEADEAFSVELTNLNANSRDVSLGTATVTATILNDDRDPNVGDIHGLKYWDQDRDGERDAGEPGLAGWTIYIDGNKNSSLDWTDGNSNGIWDEGEGEQWTATGFDGTYVLADVPAGNHVVHEVVQEGWEQTYPASDGFVLSSDFSSDPGWVTNDSAGNAWSASDETYSISRTNINGGGGYAYKETDFSGGSFTLEGDLNVTATQVGAFIPFGLLDSDVNGETGHFVRAYFAHDSGGRRVYLDLRDADGNASGVLESEKTFSLNVWYRISLTYNVDKGTLVVDIENRDTATMFTTLSLSNVTNLAVMPNIGGSNKRHGNHTYVGAQAAAKIDNVRFVGSGTPSIQVGTGDVVADVNFGNSLLPTDFGDAPDSYSTTFANNGARHLTGSGPFLGTLVDDDPDGQPDASATGDDSNGDDEDGIQFTSLPLAVGEVESVKVVASAIGLLNGWIDFDDNGNWADPGEQVFQDKALIAGENLLSFNVPPSATPSDQTFARFRLSTQGDLAYDGFAPDGEVEDYLVTIIKLNQPPVLERNAGITVDEAESRVIGSDELLTTDIDVPAQTLTYTIMTAPAHGTLFKLVDPLGLNGTFTQLEIDAENVSYRHDGSETTSDSAVLAVSDGIETIEDVLLRITVAAVNDAPTAAGQTVNTDEDSAKPITLTGSDPDGNELTFTIVDQPQHGTLTGDLPNVTYTPAANYHGDDRFTFNVNDGALDSVKATVEIKVDPVNDAPLASDQAVTTDEDAPKPISLAGSDIDGDELTYMIVDQPDHGELSGELPTPTYTPDANFNGDDTFTFKVNDGKLDSSEATVEITVNSTNDPPSKITLSPVLAKENVPGAKIGELSVLDPDAGDSHTLVVKDDKRFVIEGNQLRLVEGNSLIYEESNPRVVVTVAATDSGGLIYAELLTIHVLAYRLPYHNDANPLDSTGDGEIVPRDVLVIINEIEEHNPYELPLPPPTPIVVFYDTNGDGWISPIDVLLVINFLERVEQATAEGEALTEWKPALKTQGTNESQPFQPSGLYDPHHDEQLVDRKRAFIVEPQSKQSKAVAPVRRRVTERGCDNVLGQSSKDSESLLADEDDMEAILDELTNVYP